MCEIIVYCSEIVLRNASAVGFSKFLHITYVYKIKLLFSTCICKTRQKISQSDCYSCYILDLLHKCINTMVTTPMVTAPTHKIIG